MPAHGQSRRIKLLQIIDSLNAAGAENVLLSLLSQLDQAHYDITVTYFTPGPWVSRIAATGARLHRIRYYNRFDPLIWPQMLRIMRAEKPDIVHTHLFKSDLYGGLSAWLTHVPVRISTLHNADHWRKVRLLSLLARRIVSHYHAFVAVSPEVKNFVCQTTGLASHQIITIPNGVDVEAFAARDNREQTRQSLGILADAPVVGIVGRLEEQKGHSYFLQAVAQIISAVPKARFLVVGDGTLRTALEQQAEQLGVADHALFLGMRSDIPNLLSAMDILVFSSLWEGLPIALLEGMAARLPVVATRAGGMSSVVHDGQTGLLVSPADPDELADAITTLIQHPQLAHAMGTAGQQRVRTQYSEQAMVDQVTDLYERLLSDKGLR
jgi:glycosyltransferase involved in cell wall biosynthesis